MFDAFDLVEKRGRRELEEVGEEVQAAAVRHPDNDVFHASLYQYDLSGNERRECKARRTLCRRLVECVKGGFITFHIQRDERQMLIGSV